LGEVDDLGGVAGEIPDRRIDLSEGDLHQLSVKLPGMGLRTSYFEGHIIFFREGRETCYNIDFVRSGGKFDAPAKAVPEVVPCAFQFSVPHPLTHFYRFCSVRWQVASLDELRFVP
jgi:hypothetical protein